MIIFYLQMATLALSIAWFDLFGIHRSILTFFNKPKFDDMKPFTCFFCMNNYFGIGLSISFMLSTSNYRDALLFIIVNFVMSRVFDSILGYGSIKEK